MNSERVKLDSDENTANLRRWRRRASHCKPMKDYPKKRHKHLHFEQRQSNSCCPRSPGANEVALTAQTPQQWRNICIPTHAPASRPCEWNADRLLTQGWSMRNYSHWLSVDREDIGTIRVHCRGCLISPCSAESLAYVLCPVINVNLCSL